MAFPAALEQAETAYVRAWRQQRGCDAQQAASDTLVGLALSGGGIRSATFALGAIQALAAKDLLKKFDYLSTVSGGGYIGGAISWLLSDKAQADYARDRSQQGLDPDPPFGTGPGDFPFGTDDPRPDAERRAGDTQRRMLKYLREHGYYLTPGAGISVLSLFGIVLRGTFLNLVVWMPAYILFFLFGLSLFGALGFDYLPVLGRLMVIGHQPELFGFELFLWIGLGLLGLTIAGVLVYSLLTWVRRENPSPGVAHSWYQTRRLAERFGALVIAAIVLTLLIGCLPAIASHLTDYFNSMGPLAMLSGMVMAMRRFLTPRPQALAPTVDLTANLGAGLFLFGTLLVAFDIAFWSYSAELALLVGPVLIAVMVLFGWIVNINYTSIHRFYRDRLMETFMPDIMRALSDETGAAEGADVAMLADLIDPETPRGPYHIINTNVVLADSHKRVYATRGGDNFILSPLFCGSNATGWCPTRTFCEGKMTLATAIAVSGAAVNPNTGVGGTGLTRARLLSFVMALLDLRLGYWASHPAPDRRPHRGPNHFIPGAYAAGNLIGLDHFGFNEDRSFLQLSDGGHFENTGVYELVRRRARLIVVCDGAEDSAFSFSDFQTTLRRIEQDFGARIKALDDASPDCVVPAPGVPPVFPGNARFSDQGHLIGRIIYPDDSHGWLIYLKATLTEAMSFKVKGYAAQNPEFPHQSTVDQFFDDVQFEAYRELGYRLTADMLAASPPKDMKDSEGLPYGSDTTAARNLADVIKACSA